MCVSLQAQTVKEYEFEPFLGLSYPTRNIGGGDIKETIGSNVGLAFRYNLQDIPVSVGAVAYLCNSVRSKDSYSTDNSQRIASLSLTGDYNFMEGSKVSPFIGIELGYAQRHTISSSFDDNIGNCSNNGFVVSPRIGVEVWNHVRLTLDARITQRDYNVVCFGLGYAFGGGLEK